MTKAHARFIGKGLNPSRCTGRPKARLVYVTPSQQFPFGVTMSLGRRLALLEWARRSDAFILEDDYDGALSGSVVWRT
jgi:GntR family transcriptional regulator/MocR family aminotransferase